MSTVGCWVNWIHVGNLNLQLKLKPALMFGASKGKSVFLVQIAARCSAARLGANTRKRSCGERPQLSRKSHSDSGGQLIKLTPFFLFPLFFPAVIHLFIHITSVRAAPVGLHQKVDR